MRVTSPKWIIPHYLESSASLRGDAIALVDGDRRVTYSELRAQVFKLATRLREHGVGPGDRVIMLMANSTDFALAFWAIQYAGAVAVPLNPAIPSSKLQWILLDCSPSSLIVDASFSSRAPDVHALGLTSTQALCIGGAGTPALQSLDHATGHALEWDVNSVAIDQDLACIIYTSGSTGTPKGVMLSHLNLVAASSSVADYLGLTSDDRIFCAIPFTFDYGLHQITMSTLVGATLIVERSFAQPLFSLHRLAQHRATVFPLVPSMVGLIEPLAARFNLSQVRTVTSTAATLHPQAIDRLQQMFPNARIFSMYGLTECHRCTYLDPSELPHRKSSVGKAIPNTGLWVVDEHGTRHDRGATGELIIRGSTVMKGYWNNSVDTKEKLRPGPFPGETVLYTGDICALDQDGFVYFVCRKDDVLKVNGHKVPPKEVEQALLLHPEVTGAAVIGVPHRTLGDELVAFVSLREGSKLDIRTLRAWCALHLEPFMVPRRLTVLAALPKTPNGKIDRLALKDRATSRPEASRPDLVTTPLLHCAHTSQA
jgi:amino acid adenylation domain-containing protein